MKQPLWILNSSLLVLLFMSQLLLFMLQKVVPRRVSIHPGVMEVVPEETPMVIDIARIYQQDLFGTYQPPVVTPVSVVEEVVVAIPRPPKVIVPEIPVEKAPTFFAPLDVVLKGVIFVKDDPANCIAIVQLKKTKEDRNYQVGDLIEDAQILKILSNRIIIIRSNGQQETLYLREEDAISDFNIEAKSVSPGIVEKISQDRYKINIDEFTKKISNLGEFINLLDLMTVYKQGKSFGCRVGKIEQNSLGSMLGFNVDDIIVKVDDFYVDDLADRIALYDHVINKSVGQTIEVVLYRNDEVMTILYGLTDNDSNSVVFTQKETRQKILEELSKHEAEKLRAKNDIGAVLVQSVTEDTITDDFLGASTIQSNDFKEDLQELLNEDNSQYPSSSFASQKKNMNDTNSSVIIQSLDRSAANQADFHTKKLMQEHDKMKTTLQDMKSQDKQKMMKQSRKNVIFNGMQ